MKVIATRDEPYGFILEASDGEVQLLAKIERVLEGETTDDSQSIPSVRKIQLPDHEKLEKTLYLFLKSVRAQNDFVKVFDELKELLGK